jgi:hypothetical protein
MAKRTHKGALGRKGRPASTALRFITCAVMVLAAAACSPRTHSRKISSELVSEGGLWVPERGFLYLDTSEHDVLQLTNRATTRDVNTYLSILYQGANLPEPASIVSHRKEAASAGFVILESGTGLPVPLIPDAFRYEYSTSQGLLRGARKHLFDRARHWVADGKVLLPLWRCGVGEAGEDWAILYLGNDSLTALPHPGGAARVLAPPLDARGGGDGTVRLDARFDPTGRLVATLNSEDRFSISALDGRKILGCTGAAWDVAWNPRLPALYVTSSEGVFKLTLDGTRVPLHTGDELPPHPHEGNRSSAPPAPKRYRRIMVSPDGSRMLLAPVGPRDLLGSVPLDIRGLSGGRGIWLPPEAAGADFIVWEPGSGHILWCFVRSKHEAWRINAVDGKRLGVWKYPVSSGVLKAFGSGYGSVTVTLSFHPPGTPPWNRGLAYLDTKTMSFVGVNADPPVKAVHWRAVNASGGQSNPSGSRSASGSQTSLSPSAQEG